ncbi:MAG: peptidase S8, partial [Lysobacterales bacterium]
MRTKSRMQGGALVRILLAASMALGLSMSASASDPDPDRYIVSFLDVGKGKAALKAAGARIELELAGREAAAVHIPPKALNGLRNNPNIEYIEKDTLRFPMAQTTPWGIPAVQANLVSDGSAGNRKICIIDSGYAASHEDLTGNNAAGKSGTYWNSDSYFHG